MIHGTLDYPYVQGMAFEKDKYYKQYGVIYLCILTNRYRLSERLERLAPQGGKAMKQIMLLKVKRG